MIKIYGIKWCKLGESFVDNVCFKTIEEANTYSGICLTQMEYDGWQSFLLTFDSQ